MKYCFFLFMLFVACNDYDESSNFYIAIFPSSNSGNSILFEMDEDNLLSIECGERIYKMDDRDSAEEEIKSPTNFFESVTQKKIIKISKSDMRRINSFLKEFKKYNSFDNTSRFSFDSWVVILWVDNKRYSFFINGGWQVNKKFDDFINIIRKISPLQFSLEWSGRLEFKY